MHLLTFAIAAGFLILLLWVAYRIGKILLRIALGLLFLALLAIATYLLLHHPVP